jgi:Protein of unknown function (DUF4232)
VQGSFAAVADSAGAGSITYRLRLRNRSAHVCFVTGIPRVTLLDATGRKLPTAARAARTGIATGAMIQLRPGAAAFADARFSPDVPGVGEPVTGRQCEPRASRLRVWPGGAGSTTVPIRPATPVCEHGRLLFSLWQHG